jgi:hypothetical protein
MHERDKARGKHSARETQREGNTARGKQSPKETKPEGNKAQEDAEPVAPVQGFFYTLFWFSREGVKETPQLL